MTVYYCGPGGSDGNSGLTWVLRKASLNGCEDIPVAANDTVYVGPGVYRETLTVDVSGSSGQPITYIADVTGANTDGVGGIVRVTGSNDDQTATRSNWITCSVARDYRTFRGFLFDSQTSVGINNGSSAITSNNWIIEQCTFFHAASGQVSIRFNGDGSNHLVQNCFFYDRNGITIENGSTVNDRGHVVQNCVFISKDRGIRVDRVGGITVRNCTFFGGSGTFAVGVATALAGGQVVGVYNNLFTGIGICLSATTTGELLEDYNNFWSNTTNRTNVAVGGSSLTYPPLFNPRIHFNGMRFPYNPFELSNWSQVKAMGAVSLPSDDYFGTFRPTSGSKGSWGAIQYVGQVREITTTHSGSIASVNIPDWGGHQIWVPTTDTSTTISVYVYREADYSGTLPRMVIKQPGQSDRTTTDTGSAATWNQLTDTFTPSANTDYVVVELQSLNTATAGNYDVFFDDLAVS